MSAAIPVYDLGRVPYREALDFQRRAVEMRSRDEAPDVLYVVEHDPVLTVGRSGHPENLRARDLHRYLRDLEQALIDCLGAFGLSAGRNPPFTGVWVGEKKVAAIGVAVRHWVAFHGFALNVNPDLSHFDLIHPCGIRHLGVGSMASLLGDAPPREAVLAQLARSFSRVWDRPVDYPAPLEMLASAPLAPLTSHV